MSAVAQQLSNQYCKSDTLEVTALHRATGLITLSEGLAVCDNWTDVFEVVRWRRLFSKRWNHVQTVEQAAERVLRHFFASAPTSPPSNAEADLVEQRSDPPRTSLARVRGAPLVGQPPRGQAELLLVDRTYGHYLADG